MTFLGLRTERFGGGSPVWLGSPHGAGDANVSVTLDKSAFTEAIHYPNGYLPSGTLLGKITATGKYGPYNVTDEVQTLTEGGSGLTSFTITYSGQTTTSLDDDATAAEVQAALAALSNVGAGNVIVTGGPLATGPFTVSFVGALADTNVAQMTTTPTGGTGTVTVATATAGGTEGSGGLDVLVGILMNDCGLVAGADSDPIVAMFVHGRVINSKLPIAVDANGRADVAGRIWFI